ncbi:MAG: TonB-dependent siderophore receptor [Rariglobus sp.]|nr:TonB-dependent siderophore receptor [Rariglobus sp.]
MSPLITSGHSTTLLRVLAALITLAPALHADETATTPGATDSSGTAPASSASPASGNDAVLLAPVAITGATDTTPPPAITSTRLALTERETPQSISTISRDQMLAENLFSVDDVLRNVTGVHTAFFDTERPLYYARGFQITDFQVDGIPSYSGSSNMDYDTALYQSVTVIRGANSLISGAGIPSAVVNLERKRPGKEFDASIAGTVGSWDLYRTEIDVNTPFTPDGRVRGRFVVFGETADSFLDRYSDETTGFLASLEADLTATTTVGVGYQFQKNEPDNPMWGTIPWFAADGSEAHLSRSTNFSTDWTYWNRESGTAFINLDQKLGENWNFRGSFNRTTGKTDRLAVYSVSRQGPPAGPFTYYLPDPATGTGIRLLAGANRSEEVRDNIDLYLSGKFTALEREHDLVFGWNSNNHESDAATLAGTASWFYDIPDYRNYNGSGVPAPVITETGASRVTYTEQSGFYGTTRLRVIDPVAVILGARISEWRTYVKNYNTSDTYIGRTGVAQATGEVTPYVGVVYDITDSVAAYASYTETFRPQTQKDKDFDVLSPTLGTNAEAGVKAELIRKRLEVDLAVFETKMDNYAVLDPSVPANSLPDGTNAYMGVDGTESRGVEIEFHALLAEGWTATLGYANVNTRRNPADLTYANVPEHLVRLNTHYRLPGEWKRLSVGGGVQWQGEQTGVVTTHPSALPTEVRQAPFALVNFFATYRFTDHFTGTLSVRNAFDKTYWATLDYPNYGEPRSVQFTLRRSY